MLTCKQFLQELNDYLDPSVDAETKAHLKNHVNACPNCFVVVDTTLKTLKVYKGMEAHAVPEDLRSRLWAAVERKMAAKKAKAAETEKKQA